MLVSNIFDACVMSLTESRRFVFADPGVCTGCGVCQLVCSLAKENAFDPDLSRIKVIRLYGMVNLVAACRFCEDAPCVVACPRDALTQREDGVIVVDEVKCDGCRWCIEACKYGAIVMNPEKKVVMICDLCGELEPQCVEWCPEGALELITEEEAVGRVRLALASKLALEAWR